MKNNNVDIEKYLTLKGIAFRVSGNELITKCIFSDCDSDSRGEEAHLYFSRDTGQYQCKKCDAKGNIITLKKHFGDFVPKREIKEEKEQKRNRRTLTPSMVEEYHRALTPEILKYLYERGISDTVIENYKVGYGYFYGKRWITFPIKDIDGNYLCFKLRQDPKDGKEKMTWPNGVEAQIYDWDTLRFSEGRLLVVEGEGDVLLMKSNGVESITNTHGAMTVKEFWMEHFKTDIEYFICYDNDDTGRKGAYKMANTLLNHGCNKIKIITLPEEVDDKGDLGDYVVRLGLSIDDLFTKYAKEYPERIDTSDFKEITIQDVCKVLDATIKKDDNNKATGFLSMLTTYTYESQMNVFFNAPSSTGKSHIPLSLITLFPKEDVITLAHCSPTAFFHEQGKFDKEKNEIVVDLSKKIIVFTDMPDTALISRLRPILSHDEKETHFKMTDKNQKGGNRTKNVTLIGYPSVYFCSAGLKVDEQESTRFLMVSPSVENDKLLQGIQQSIMKESDREKFMDAVNSDPERIELQRRILAIKQAEIYDVKIENTELIERLYFKDSKTLKPRQQRDIKKIISLIKGFALLNLWFRKSEDNFIWANDADIENTFTLWNSISIGQDYGLAPYVFEIYTKIILVLWNEPSEEWGPYSSENDKKHAVSRKQILDRHYKIYGRPLSSIYLRQHILPQLEQVGLIMQERSVDDKREMVVIPLETEIEPIKNYSDEDCGVNMEMEEMTFTRTEPLPPEKLPF